MSATSRIYDALCSEGRDVWLDPDDTAEMVVAVYRELVKGDLPEREACPECESRNTSWSMLTRVTGAAPDGRLRSHEVKPILVLGCDECSATLRTVETDEGLEDLLWPAPILIEVPPRGLEVARQERDDARGDYEVIRDAVIDQLNPRDDDIGEPSLMVESIEAAARFIDSLPCTCPPDAGPPEWETPCARCQALGRAKDERIDR